MADSPGTFSRTDRWLEYIYVGLIIAFVLYQLWYIIALPYEVRVHAIVHLGFAMPILLIAKLRKTKSKAMWAVLLFMIVLSLVGHVYLFTDYYNILKDPSYPPMAALVFTSITTIIAFILVKWSFGPVFPIFAGLATLYVIYGSKLPGGFTAPRTTLQRAITLLAADVTSPWGSYGSLLSLSANYLFLFIVFGAVLNAFGGLKFVVQLGSLVASKMKSGPAALSIVSSALLGSVTGSSAANITVTGSFTIPMMKDSGYTPEQASAIEAAASNGGQFLPPIMGATVFVMAAYTGIPYVNIMKAAAIPAIMYFIVLLFYAELNARKLNLKVQQYSLDVKQILFDAPRFLIPFGVLLTLLLQGYSLMRVVFWSVLVVIAIGLLYGLLSKARLNWTEVKDNFCSGVYTGAQVACILAVVGVVVAAIEVTGLSLRLSVILGGFAGDSVLRLLLLTMITSLILGTGLPTTAAYVIVATVLSPLMLRAGIPLLQAHLFPLFYAIVSHLTPPIGIGLIIASNIAGANYRKSAYEVFKAAYPVLLLPFFFIYSPEILLQHETLTALIAEVVGIMAMFFAGSVFLNNIFKIRLDAKERLLMLVSFVLFFVFVFNTNIILFAVALAACVAAMFLNLKRGDDRGKEDAVPV